MRYFPLILIAVIGLLAYTQHSVDTTIVGHWELDSNAMDISSYGSHGIVHGDPQPVDGPKGGTAYDFDGDDYIEIRTNDRSPAHLEKLASGSISLWFKARSWNVDSTMLPLFYYGRSEGCPEAFDATNEGLVIEVGHGGIFPSENVFYTAYDTPCGYPTMCFDSNDEKGKIRPDKWYHFVVVVGEDYNTGYLNGEELTDRRYNFHSDSASLFFADALAHEKMWFGKGYWKGKELYFDGAIDDVRIYKVPLDAEGVKELYEETE